MNCYKFIWDDFTFCYKSRKERKKKLSVCVWVVGLFLEWLRQFKKKFFEFFFSSSRSWNCFLYFFFFFVSLGIHLLLHLTWLTFKVQQQQRAVHFNWNLWVHILVVVVQRTHTHTNGRHKLFHIKIKKKKKKKKLFFLWYLAFFLISFIFELKSFPPPVWNKIFAFVILSVSFFFLSLFFHCGGRRFWYRMLHTAISRLCYSQSIVVQWCRSDLLENMSHT